MLKNNPVKRVTKLFPLLVITACLTACQATSAPLTVAPTPTVESSSTATSQAATSTPLPTEMSTLSPVPTLTLEPTSTLRPGTMREVSPDHFDGADSWRVMGVEYLSGPRYSPDGSQIAMVSSEGIMIYDPTTLELLNVLDSGRSYAAAWSADGTRLAVHHDDNEMSVWDLVSGSEVASYQGAYDIYGNLGFSLDGGRLAFVTTDESENAVILDTESGELIELESGTSCYILLFSPDGQSIAGEGGVAAGYIWDTATGAKIFDLDVQPPELGPHEMFYSWTTAIDWSLQGDKLALGLIKGYPAIMIYDTQTGEVLADIDASPSSEIFRLIWLPDGKHVLSTSGDSVRIWDTKTSEEVGRINRYGKLDDIALSPDGEYLIVLRTDGIVIRLNMADVLGETDR